MNRKRLTRPEKNKRARLAVDRIYRERSSGKASMLLRDKARILGIPQNLIQHEARNLGMRIAKLPKGKKPAKKP